MALWHDRRGRLSLLRLGTLVVLALPALELLYYTVAGDLGPRPVNEAIHHTGLWGIRFLILSLLITPVRRLARHAPLIDVRRMVGVVTFCYLALHLSLYVIDQSFDIAKVASEIVLRFYLTIGFVAWLGLATLAATSNDYMVRRLGGVRWRKLHRIVYGIGVLACIHYFMQSKLDVFQPTVLTGIFGWLMLYRISHWTMPRRFFRADGELSLWLVGMLGIVTAALTFVFEAIGLWLVHGVSPLLVLEINFTFVAGIRPGWYVLMAGAALFLVGLWRRRPESGLFSFASGSASRTSM